MEMKYDTGSEDEQRILRLFSVFLIIALWVGRQDWAFATSLSFSFFSTTPSPSVCYFSGVNTNQMHGNVANQISQ